MRHCNGLRIPTGKPTLAAIATGFIRDREGGSEVKARSQDTGLAVLVVVVKRRTGGLPVPLWPPNFSVKEKDEASLPRECGGELSNAFILRFAGA